MSTLRQVVIPRKQCFRCCVLKWLNGEFQTQRIEHGQQQAKTNVLGLLLKSSGAAWRFIRKTNKCQIFG
jgi:hypothetical protein